MSLVISIQPFSDVLDMHGDPDSSSTFSLSGHVVVSLTSPSSLFSRRKSIARIVLQSLTITFEGQSEVVSPAIGYTSIRLCSITRELLSGDPVELSNEGHEDSDKPCLWNIVFDIPVPGWLPTTSIHGEVSSRATGTSYALYATATFVDINHNQSSSFFATICCPVRSRTRRANAPRHPIILRRFVDPQPSSSSMLSMSSYLVAARRTPNSAGTSIPIDVLEKIQIVASIPSATAMDEAFIPFVLRVRGKDMNNFERTQLRITGFSIDVEQVEVYRTNSSRDNTKYPIPSQHQQPPRVPLRNPHPIHTLYQTGFLRMFRSSVKRAFSLVPPTESGRYIISGGGHILAEDQSSSPEDNWYILETKIPIFTKPYLRDWAGARKRRITENSPLFSVEHYVRVVVHCEYDLPDSSKPILERLHFSIPMRVANVPKVAMSPSNPTENLNGDGEKNTLHAQTLPAYSQLFHSNGERKLDSSTPLPLYEPLSHCLGSSL